MRLFLFFFSVHASIGGFLHPSFVARVTKPASLGTTSPVMTGHKAGRSQRARGSAMFNRPDLRSNSKKFWFKGQCPGPRAFEEDSLCHERRSCESTSEALDKAWSCDVLRSLFDTAAHVSRPLHAKILQRPKLRLRASLKLRLLPTASHATFPATSQLLYPRLSHRS